MPSLGADMEYGTLVAWRIQPGDTVQRGDVVALVETQKGLFEVEIFAAGVVEELRVAAGTRVPVGTVLATLGPPSGAPAPAVTPGPAAPVTEAVTPTTAAAGKTHRRASPLARRVAETLHVDLDTVEGTGAGGAVTREDVEHAATARDDAAAGRGAAEAPAGKPAARPSEEDVDRSAAMRQAIAAAVSRSKREIPHYYLATDIPLHAALMWLQAENTKRPLAERMLPAVLLVKAVALAVRRYPEFNGFWMDGAFRPASAIHVGLAVALRSGGLIVAAIHDTDRKSLDELMRDLRAVVQRTREGRLRASEIADATLTVTNLGDQGVDTVFGVIYPPQVALVGFGRVRERPWAENGMVGVRPIISATLAADHRASDGHRGSLLLGEIARLLQNPEQL
jgi:pyruvate dehydrogenase E2 component (dihydrolipoamide acetyltransferase)